MADAINTISNSVREVFLNKSLIRDTGGLGISLKFVKFNYPKVFTAGLAAKDKWLKRYTFYV
ncbi:hypothetical protein MuYL_1567 [Mucilaginibacter xinganensis]|uniref:Uncharacterized protein n=1 Tax=Mucilaginibacter xinganensis TaxID=1234841 RepID=A0A223NU98_9SPHI|nr:hypothetical protein MuYL_1567 [Mucilaginibacter xinganensis]